MSDLDIATELAISGILTDLVNRMKDRIAETVAQSAFYGIIQAQRELKLPINPIAAKQPALTYAQRYQEELNRGGTTINGEFIDWFEKYSPKENADAIADIITRGMREGKPLGRWEYRGMDGIYPSDTVADDIMKHMGQQYKSGASRIARTEVVRTLNENSLDRYKASQVTHVMVRDGCGCAVCAEINGSIWTIEESYHRTTEHPNCRRSFTPILPGYPLPEQMAASPMPEDDPGSSYYQED